MLAVAPSAPGDALAIGRSSRVVKALTLTRRQPISDPFPYVVREPARGRAMYYRVVLRCRVRFGSRGSGYGYINAVTDRDVSASIEIARERPSTGEPKTTVSLVNAWGARRYATRQRSMQLALTNYVRVSGSRPGRHALRFQLQRYDGLDIERVEVLPLSGVFPTRVPPVPLSLGIAPGSGSPTVGKPVRLRLELSNAPGAPKARSIVVTVASDRYLQVVKRPPLRWGDLGAGRGKEAIVTVVPLASGERRLTVHARSVTVGSAAGEVVIEASGRHNDDERTAPGRELKVAALIGCIILAIGFGSRLGVRRRRGRTAR